MTYTKPVHTEESFDGKRENKTQTSQLTQVDRCTCARRTPANDEVLDTSKNKVNDMEALKAGHFSSRISGRHRIVV